MPTNELVRLVRIYSSPWEEKSQALKRLHEQYQSMKSQLLIALRKLQLHEGEVSIFARENAAMFKMSYKQEIVSYYQKYINILLLISYNTTHVFK